MVIKEAKEEDEEDEREGREKHDGLVVKGGIAVQRGAGMTPTGFFRFFLFLRLRPVSNVPLNLPTNLPSFA